MSRYESLINKAILCRDNAEKAESQWAKDYWINTANKLEIIAGNLPIVKAEEK